MFAPENHKEFEQVIALLGALVNSQLPEALRYDAGVLKHVLQADSAPTQDVKMACSAVTDMIKNKLSPVSNLVW